MEEQEFLKRAKRVNCPRVFKVTNSYGVYDAFKYYRKTRPKDSKFVLTESKYFSIIRTINNKLRELLIAGNDIEFPCRMGKIEVRKKDVSFIKKNGKVTSNAPIDWNATLKLWYEDPNSYKEKFLVKIVEDEVFRILYNKATACYENKSFYQFTPNRELKLGLKKAIKNSKFDTFKTY